MNILTRKREFLQSISPEVPARLSKLFAFGCEALVGHTVVSLRANARVTHHEWFVAKSKAWRLTTNKNLVAAFQCIFARVCTVVISDIVAIDFSDFKNNWQVLMFARQTREGRAFPLFFDVISYPVKEGSQNLFIVATIKRFLELSCCTPTLVFDRGFAIPYLIRFLAQNNIRFIIRIKRRKYMTVERTKKRAAVEELGVTDEIVEEWGVSLRLIVSNKPEGDGEPWYLITNDTTSTREEIITRYYHRFEIEEFFRDTKRLLGLEHHQMKSIRSLSILLWFVILGTWFFHFCINALSDDERAERKRWRVSYVRYIWELLRREAWREMESAEVALSVGLKPV
jgi:hypothetical protein